MVMSKICSYCKNVVKEGEFYQNLINPEGDIIFENLCQDCHNKLEEEIASKNGEKIEFDDGSVIHIMNKSEIIERAMEETMESVNKYCEYW